MTENLFDLKGRTALVTGGSKGLGQAIAWAFAEAGAAVMICSRHEEELRRTADEIEQGTGGRVLWSVADMTDRGSVAALAESAIAELQHVDILVNNAGSNTPQVIDEVQDDDWDRIVELNLTSCMALTRALCPGMKDRGWGRIIHVSSIVGLCGAPARNVYAATKAGLIGMSRASALDLGRHGITVNCLAPGPFLTELPAQLLTQEQRDRLAERTAVGRWGDPKELAGPALLLASEAGSYITGAVLVVDGGILSSLV